MDPEYLLIRDAAELLRVPIGTIYDWRRRGEGPPARKIGKRLLYRKDEVIAWAEAQLEEPAAS